MDLLLAVTRRTTEEADARELAAELGDLPLALEQAAAYIAQRGIPISEYRRRLAAQPVPTFAAPPEGADAERTVARVWAVTMNTVAERSSLAAELLRILSVLAPEQLPADVLTATGQNPITVEDALSVLASYSMITFGNGMVSVHRVVQMIARGQDPDPRLRCRTATALLRGAAPDEVITNVSGWPRWKMLAPHVEALYALKPSDERSDDMVFLRNGAATFLQGQGQLDRAIAIFEQNIADQIRTVGTDHPITLAARNNLALAYRFVGRSTEAIDLYEPTLVDQIRVLGTDHPDTLRSRINLAGAYQSVGRSADAIALYEPAIEDQVRVLGTNHPDTLRSRNNLAFAYQGAGRSNEAIDLYERNLADRVLIFGTDHPNTLASKNNLAGAYRDARRLHEAIDLYERNLADRVRILGTDHPDTLRSRSNLAGAYQAIGRLTEAADLYERTLADQVRILGTEHPDAVRTRTNFAGARSEQDTQPATDHTRQAS